MTTRSPRTRAIKTNAVAVSSHSIVLSAPFYGERFLVQEWTGYLNGAKQLSLANFYSPFLQCKCCQLLLQTTDLKTEIILANQEATLVLLEWVSTLSLKKNPVITPKKTNRLPRRCNIWRYCFQTGAWNCRILNQAVISQLFTSLWHRYQQWLSYIKLFQIVLLISASHHRINSCYTANRGFKLSGNLRTPENDHLYISIVYG
jgi:hypothetical protein